MILETERLILKPFTMADTQTLYHLATDPYLAKCTRSFIPPFSFWRAVKWVRNTIVDTKQMKNITLAIRLKSNNAVIGAVSIKFSKVSEPEIGYWLGFGYRHKGYCTEAVRELIRFLFLRFKLTKVVGRCDVNNLASAKVMVRSGMHLSKSRLRTARLNNKTILLQTYEVFPPPIEIPFYEPSVAAEIDADGR